MVREHIPAEGLEDNPPKRAKRASRDPDEEVAKVRAPGIGLVLSGGGARGAYEAGVMSVLLPALEARGERPNIYVGTSVGAINAAYLASSRHLPRRRGGRGRRSSAGAR